MPSLEQIYEKLDILEKKISEVRDGFSSLDDIIVDYFNTNTIPGNEIVNERVDELNNVEIKDGVATIINPVNNTEGYLKSAVFNCAIPTPQTCLLRPTNEDIRADFLVYPEHLATENISQELAFLQNDFTYNMEVIEDNGQRDYGARFVVSETTYLPYRNRWNFQDGGWGNFWTLERSNILWETLDIAAPGDPKQYILQCTATEPLQIFANPQYSLNRFGVAVWSDIKLGEANEIKVGMKATLGSWIHMGLALRLKDALNGYFALLETEPAGSFVRLYKIANGLISKIVESPYDGEIVLDRTYEVAANMHDNQIQILIDGIQAIDCLLDPLDIVATTGDFGIVTMATSVVQVAWVETAGAARNVIAPLEGVVTTAPFLIDNVNSWLTLEVDSSILQGRLELDYSLDDGLTFITLPQIIINYPEPVTKLFDITHIPVVAGNNIIFRARLYGMGLTGWLRAVRLKYLSIPQSPYVMANTRIHNGVFELEPGHLQGIIITPPFLPKQIYAWDKIVADHYQGTVLDPISNLHGFFNTMVDSFQEPYVSDYIVDDSLDTYWESKRGSDSWVAFEFAEDVEIHRFRWVKKSATDGATFYNFQVFDETTNAFTVVQTFGYEVNHDIMHTLDKPIQGKKFRLYINCVQPMSFGNARLIELFGKAVISKSSIEYQYSLDDGLTFNSLPADLSLAGLPIHKPVRFLIRLSRTTPDAPLYVKKAAYRFIGRDPNAIQITDLQYDLWLGDKFIYNIPPFETIDIRCVNGNSLQLKIRFLINREYLFCGLKPWLSGYRIGVTNSHYQAQLDALQAHINSVLRRADRDPGQDMLVDAIVGLIAQEAENMNGGETDVDKIILRLVSYLNTEVAHNRSRMVLGDVGHLDESLPSELFDADILL